MNTETTGHAGDGDVIKRASISQCNLYRYRLTRYWGPGYVLPFVMLNPSTADASVDDPTIRRCMAFARRQNAGGIIVANLFAFRATSPSALLTANDPIGPDNDTVLTNLALEANATNMPIVCAWGTLGLARAMSVFGSLKQRGVKLVCLGKTKANHPRHPLYVKGDQPLMPYP